MGRTAFTLNTLPGARRSRSIELNYGLSDPEGVKKWQAGATPAGGGKHVNYYGQEKGEVSRFNRRMVLRGVNVSQENWHHLRSWRDQGEPLALSPLWPADTALTVLPLGKPAPGEDPLQDFLIADKRSAVDFERYSTRFHPDSGLPAGFHVPLYTDGWQGEQINVGDVINDAHFPSFEYRAYVDRDAEDVGSITRVYLDPRWDADNFWVGQLVCIQTRELSTNYYEIARVDAVNSAGNYLDLSQTTVADAVCTNTSEYTFAQRTSISNNLCPDGDLSDSGVGTWPDRGAPGLVEKTDTGNETGTRALRVIGSANDTGTETVLGSVPADTNLWVMIRLNAVRGSIVYNLHNDTDAIDHAEGAPVAGWQWMMNAVVVAQGGAGQKEIHLQFFQSGAVETEMTVDRIEIYQNDVTNGAMEPEAGDTYDSELAAITSSNAATTTYNATRAVDGNVWEWDLSDVEVGMIAVADGKHGRITAIDDPGELVDLDDGWVGGIPANGTQCDIHIAVSPDWNQQAIDVPPGGGDVLIQDADEHGGDYAQGVDVDGNAEGIISTANVYTADVWYWSGAFFKVASGTCAFNPATDPGLIEGINDATYTLRSGVFLSSAAQKLKILSEPGGCDFLVDDVFAVRLPCLNPTTEGGPFDDAIDDLPEQVDTDGVIIIGCYVPDVANTALTEVNVMLHISRPVYDAANRIYIDYNYATTTMQFSNAETGSGIDQSNIAATTFSAGDKIFFALKIDGGTGAMKSWRKVGTAAASTGTGAGATIAAGLSRMWLRSGSSDEFNLAARGSLSGYMVINEIMSDADIEEVLEIMAGDTGYEQDLTLLEETYGIIYEIEPNGITPWHPADGEYITCDIALREVGRIGAFRNAY